MRLSHPTQSFSSSPSSTEVIGYLSAKLERYSINSSDDNFSLFEKTYFLFFNNSVAAQSSAKVTSLSTSYPASWMELDIKSSASSAESIPGANPPSSPTAVEKPFLFNVFFKKLNTSTPQMRPSLKEENPTG